MTNLPKGRKKEEGRRKKEEGRRKVHKSINQYSSLKDFFQLCNLKSYPNSSMRKTIASLLITSTPREIRI